MTRWVYFSIILCTLGTITACSDSVDSEESNGWNLGEPLPGDDCPDESDFDAHFGPTDCIDGDPPVGVCPTAEGYFSIYIEGCGCYCDYDSPGVQPPPEPRLCPEDDDGEEFDPTLQPADCAPGGGVQCPDVEGGFGVQIDDCGCYCGYHEPEPPAECPDEDDGYDYVSTDPDECAVIFVSCEVGQQPFSDECGCGCINTDSGSNDPEPSPGTGPTCSAWDVDAEGDCDWIIGYGYDGDNCVGYSGCDCVGSDCHRLTDSVEDCQKQIRDCDYTCGNPDGVICDVYEGIEPKSCLDGSAYTVIDCEPMCVDPNTCERVDDSN